jgi:phosphatidylglycerophosphate synthase
MIAGAPHTFGIGYMCLAVLSELGFWHIYRQNRGNRFVRSAMIAIMLMVSMGLWANFNVPDWLFLTWIVLVFLLALLTLFFFIQRGVQSLRHRRSHVG